MDEQLATIAVSRDDAGLYTVAVTHADGSHRVVRSSDWRTLAAALDFAAKLLAGDLRKRDERVRVGCPEVP